METKKCSGCGKIKPISEFYKHKNTKYGYRFQCKECDKQYRENHKQHSKQYLKQWYQDNKEYFKQWREDNGKFFKQYLKQWRINNKENLRQYGKQWRKNNPGYNKEWYENNSAEYYKEYFRNKRKKDPMFHLNCNIKTAIWLSLNGNKNGRHWEKLVGFNLQELMQHLENQFKEEMSWDNYGRGGWVIDHIKPISLFNFKSYEDEEFKECWSLDNLQPLWGEENLRKGNRYDKDK